MPKSRAQSEVYVPVLVQPGGDVVEVRLSADFTASDVVTACVGASAAAIDEWTLVGDLRGFEKRFEPAERVYQLVRKHVLLAANTDGVRFYLRKRKKRFSVCCDLDQVTHYRRLHLDRLRYPKAVRFADVAIRYSIADEIMMPSTEPPMRIAVPPTSTAAASPYAAMAYGDLMKLAERQRRQLETNKQAMQQRERQLHALRGDQRTAHAHANAVERLTSLQQSVAQKEPEVQRLRKLQVELQRNEAHSHAAKGELDRTHEAFEAKQRELRAAASRVDTLRHQLAELQRRRQAAADAATRASDEQRAGKSDEQRPTAEERPLATVEPFQVTPPSDRSRPAECPTVAVSDSGSTTPPALTGLMATKGYETVMAAVKDALAETNIAELTNCESPLTQRKQLASTKMSPEDASLSAIKPKVQLFSSPARQTSPSVSPPLDQCASPNTSAGRVSMSINRRLQQTLRESAAALDADAPPPDLIPQAEKHMFFTTPPAASGAANAANDDPFYQHIDSDKIHIRSDTLRAAKRRSWAQDATNDETEHIRRVLRREQLKGRSHINFGFIFEQPEPQLRPPPPYQPSPPSYAAVAKQRDDGASSSSDEPDRPVAALTVVDAALPSPPKGILKGAGSPARGRFGDERRNIQFDPLALLLDASLEGELDLVKKSAARIERISMSNDEGITALHNAICAGHYEIVKFLVEAEADVNAQDSDGWTPLHCAASCNNVPMVKFLVERGACVFATTLSDHETPADKCEEDEDGYDPCSQLLQGVQDGMGRSDEGRVFGAFAYDATAPDELTFGEGDELRVVDRDRPTEKGWWWAADGGGKQGYVPRNYLALCPRVGLQRRLGLSPPDLELADAAKPADPLGAVIINEE